tara:strand:+ start:3460 stop:3654 length:195 start_codon:yes stop_codon:yes gene_type:complete
MSILNYLLIGVFFSFLVDFLLDRWSYHPDLQEKKWDWNTRILAILAWPIGVIIFIVQFIKERLK